MPLFRRAPRELPTPFPRLDGSGWPDRRASRGDTFAAATYYEMARQEAFDPSVHDVTDLVVDHLLPRLDPGAAPEDEEHMQRVCTTAAQIGVGVARVERRVVPADSAGTDRDIAAVLWLAAEDLPTMAPRQQQVARYLLLCGYHLGRWGRARLPELLAALEAEDHPAVRPKN
ncbi:MAG TPA: hypothetical protein VFG72_09780 [Marmoricola sp.]|nr:hypothetical protein [Marmoricola sp.]